MQRFRSYDCPNEHSPTYVKRLRQEARDQSTVSGDVPDVRHGVLWLGRTDVLEQPVCGAEQALSVRHTATFIYFIINPLALWDELK